MKKPVVQFEVNQQSWFSMERLLRAFPLIFLSLFCGVLLWLSYPPIDVPILPWVALIPLFLVVLSTRPWQSFFLALFCGMTFFAGVFSWGLEVGSYTLLHHVLLSLCFSYHLAFIGLIVSFISRCYGPMLALAAAPFVWVSLEYIKSKMFFLAFPWGLLAHTQYRNLEIIQIASIAGAYGVSFLIVLVNAALTAFIYPYFQRLRSSNPFEVESTLNHGRMRFVLGFVALSFTAGSLVHGYLSVPKLNAGQVLKVAVVQGNIEQKKKWNPRYADFIIETYTELTQRASEDDPDLVIWPEAATPQAIDLDKRLYSQVRDVAEESGAAILVGSSSHPKLEGRRSRNQEQGFRNSAFLVHPEEGRGDQRYDKILLLPFGEYLPLRDKIPWSLINVPFTTNYVPGKELTIFEGPTYRFGVTICWENVFPELVRAFVRQGAQFIVNITNEAWFNETGAPYQFLSMSVFRAVENRVFVVRCANTGISCFIDPSGRITGRVEDAKGKDIFVQGILTKAVIPMDSSTLYTRYGDWLAALSLFLAGLVLSAGVLRKRK